MGWKGKKDEKKESVKLVSVGSHGPQRFARGDRISIGGTSPRPSGVVLFELYLSYRIIMSKLRIIFEQYKNTENAYRMPDTMRFRAHVPKKQSMSSDVTKTEDKFRSFAS